MVLYFVLSEVLQQRRCFDSETVCQLAPVSDL